MEAEKTLKYKTIHVKNSQIISPLKYG